MKRDKISIIVKHGKNGIPADSFAKIYERTLELIHGLDANLASGKRDWTISQMSINSPLHFELFAEKREGVITTSRALVGDLARMQRGERTKYLRDELEPKAIELLSVIGEEIPSIELHGERMKTIATERLPEPDDAMASMSSSYTEVGSIEGTLEIASVRGGDQVKVYDSRFNCPVGCSVTQRQFDEALGYLKRRSRVCVRGVIRFASGRPKEIGKVFDIRELPGPRDRISINSIRPIDLTGGKDPADYLRGDE